MAQNHLEIKDIINWIIGVNAIIISIIFFIITSKEDITTEAIIILVVLIIVLVLTYFYSKWRYMGKDVEDNKRDMEEIKSLLNFKELFNNMNIRLKVIEKLVDKMFDKKNKKGQGFDPRILFWILIIVLLYLFLKSIGTFG